MIFPFTFMKAVTNPTAPEGDNLRDMDSPAITVVDSIPNVDCLNILFNEAYFDFYGSMDKTAYQYNESTGQLQKRTLLSWQNFTGNRALTQADMDALPDVPTGRILKTRYNQYILVLGSNGVRQSLQVTYDLSPHTPPVLVELVKNRTNWITVNLADGTTTCLATRRWFLLDQPMVSANGQIIRFISATPPPETPEDPTGGGTPEPEEVDGFEDLWWWLFWWLK